MEEELAKYKETCLKAVKQNGLALQFVQHQDIEICLEAVNQNGMALKYVNDQRLGICTAAFNNPTFYEDEVSYDLGDKRRLDAIRNEIIRDMCGRYSEGRGKPFQRVIRRG